jgi:hypothetical protein
MNPQMTQIALQQRTAEHQAAAERARLARSVGASQRETPSTRYRRGRFTSLHARQGLVWLRLRSRQS